MDIKLEKYALGNQVGIKEMFVETKNRSMSSSILEPSLHLQQYPEIVFNKKRSS